MTNYQEFLDKAGIISEEKFNEIINSLPEVDIDSITFYNLDDEDDIATEICNEVLSKYEYASVEDLSFENKAFYLVDVFDEEDLKSIKELFKGWTIENYEDILEEIREREEEEKQDIEESKKRSIINKLLKRYSLEQLEKLL